MAGRVVPPARLGVRDLVRRGSGLLENVCFLAGYLRPGVVPEAEVQQA
ncbi:hypothetical protein ACFVH0_00410 [Streptomyces sp. NPDC127117]